jgi:pyruvate dehydrogenase E1 component
MNTDIDTLERIVRRAFVHMVTMIHIANHRDDAGEGDPKVGGHPAACASSMEMLAALHLAVRQPNDYVCCKPHASPTDHALHHQLGLFRHPDGTWFGEDEAEAVMHRLRAFSRDGEPVFQSYHAESDPDRFHFLPSGSVGIPPVVAIYLALAYRYAARHGWDLEQPHFWCMMGDSEFREGSLMEVLPEAAERELGNVTWIVDYNRQNLDGTRIPNPRGLRGTDADRIQRTCEANGWRVIQLRHGRFREAVFARKDGGSVLREIFEHKLSDYHFQTLLWKGDAATMRKALLEEDPACEKILGTLSDDDVRHLFRDLGGHDLKKLIEVLEDSKKDERVPCIVVVHTLKGRGLRCEAATGNHSALADEDEVVELLESEGLSLDRPFQRHRKDTPEAKYLEERGKTLRAGIEALDETKRTNLERVRAALADIGELPESFDVNLKLVPLAHTQWMWGQIAAKLVRIGVHDELTKAGRPAGKELTEDEQKWNAIADLLMTMAPDVGTSTNINPAMDEKVFGPESERNWEKELDLRERLRPTLMPTDEAWSRHIRFEIAEANCMSAAGSFGKMGDLIGVPFLPMMTIYDFFIKRALDQLYYNLYWGSGFILMGTPSGVSLAPEGAQHSWKSDIQIPNLVTWEPSFALELDWILSDAIRRHFAGDNVGRKGVLVRAVTRALKQDLMIKNLRRQVRFKSDMPQGAELVATGQGGLQEAEVPARPDAEILAAVREDCLAGGWYLVDWRGYRGYRPGENVVHIVTMGALAPEALDASDKLLERGIYANVLVASSSELLCGLLGRKSGYRHLRETLGIDGALHLAPAAESAEGLGALDAVDLAGRRIPIVSVHDGEEGLLDNLGSIVGVRQVSIAVRKFSKSGTPADVYGYHGMDADGIAEACGQALSETAQERVRLSGAGRAVVERQQGDVANEDWRQLWPNPVQS